MRSRYILIDGGHIAAQARYTLGYLWNEELGSTGVLFGVLSRLLRLSNSLNSKRFVFCWDSKMSLRRDIYPEYKQNRKKDWTEEEEEERRQYYKQVRLLRTKHLPALGFRNNFVQKGYEGDDIIASIVHSHRKKKCEFVIVSQDADLYQLLSPKVSQMLSASNVKRVPKLFTPSDFREKYKGLSPKDWWKVKALAGCKSDNVAGICGIGEVNAIKYLQGELPKQSARLAYITMNRKVYKRNVSLVRLPFNGVRQFKIRKDELNFKAFEALCREYDFESFVQGERRSDWIRFFGSSRMRIGEHLNASKVSKRKR